MGSRSSISQGLRLEVAPGHGFTLEDMAANLYVDTPLLAQQIITDRNARGNEVEGNTNTAWEECAEGEWEGRGIKKLILYRNVVTGQASRLKPFKLMTPWEKKRLQADPVWQELSLFDTLAKRRSKIWLSITTWEIAAEMPKHLYKAIADDLAKSVLIVQRRVHVYSAAPNPYNYTSLSDTPHHPIHRPFSAALSGIPWIDYFTSRPCPYYLKNTPGFLLFGRLPMELQLLIWECAVPEGKIVGVCKKIGDLAPSSHVRLEGYVFGLVPFYKPPAMLHTCSASRTVALRYLVPAFQRLFGKPIYFNYEKDTLQLMDRDAYDSFYHECRRSVGGSAKRTFQLLRNIAVPELSLGRSMSTQNGQSGFFRLQHLELMLNLKGLEFIFFFREPQGFAPVWPRSLAGYDGIPMTNEIIVREKGLDLASPFLLQSQPGRRPRPSHQVTGSWSNPDLKQPCLMTMHHWQVEETVRDRFQILEKAIIAKGEKN